LSLNGHRASPPIYQPAAQSTSSNSKAIPSIEQLRTAIQSLLHTVPEAIPDDLLAVFSVQPVFDANLSSADTLWEEIVDLTLNNLIGFGKEITQIKLLVKTGKYGLEGLCNWMETFIVEGGINPCLFEGKVDWLVKVIDEM
jgi:hypothetical protein